MQLTVPINKALETLHRNLDEHITELKKANEVWTEEVIEALGKMRDAMRRDALHASNAELSQLFYQKPIDNRANYSKFIGALELARDGGQTTMQIDEEDYDRMFADNWDWRRHSKTINATYTAKDIRH